MFQLQHSQKIEILDITLETYKHHTTGAIHHHFASKNPENVFMVLFCTMPKDSTGVAHILEHTALCGSKHFPVRDPFFSMIRRSLSTFMNAFTSSDWTAYPFATENEQDFQNLLSVYLDAVFFPNLHYFDFLQEGHRLEIDDHDTLTSHGVVFNEMKGVYANSIERIFEMQKSFLQPTTTYHYDSGGLPQEILDLTYENFIAFHKKHYHPSNATFLTFGNIPATQHHQVFQSKVLDFFLESSERIISVNEKRFITPLQIQTGYPSSDTINQNQTHIVVSWLLPFAHEPTTRFECEILAQFLLNNSASPLRHALENAPFVAAISPLSGLDDSGRELRFNVGIITESSEHTEATIALIYDVFTRITTQGADAAEVLAIVDHVEIVYREQDSKYPFGLSIMLAASGAITHGGDIAGILDPTATLESIREKGKNPTYITTLLQKYIINNTHRLTGVYTPDSHALQKENEIEISYHSALAHTLTPEEKKTIRDDTNSLLERQNQKDNEIIDTILPRLSISDITPTIRPIQTLPEIQSDRTVYSSATNHLAYRKWIFPLYNLSEEDIKNLPLLLEILGETGAQKQSYTDIQKEIAQKTGGITYKTLAQTHYLSKNLKGYFVVSTRYLETKESDAVAITKKILSHPRFDEEDRIKHLLSEEFIATKAYITNNPHQVAIRRSVSGFSSNAAIAEMNNSLSYFFHFKHLLEQNPQHLRTIFTDLYAKITTYRPQELCIGQQEIFTTPPLFSEKPTSDAIFTENISLPEFQLEAYIFDSAVSHCVLSFPTVPEDHVDAPVLTILGQFLQDGFLHTAIREKGGAYGAKAQYNANFSGGFTFFSYRDPRIEDTFADFFASIEWLVTETHDKLRLEEAKLQVFSNIDKPSSPAQESQKHFFQNLYGYTEQIQNDRRKELLNVRIEDLQRVARTYLMDNSLARKVVMTGPQNQDILQKAGYTIRAII